MILFCPKLGNWENWEPWMSCEGQCGKQGTQTRTRVCDNGNCANATDQSIEIRTGCTATATCTGLLFTTYYDESPNGFTM